MGQRLMFNPIPVDQREQVNTWDDFTNLNIGTGLPWASALTNSSAPALSTTVAGGVLVHTNTAAANDAAFVYSTVPLFQWSATLARPVVAEIQLQFAEASTNQANVWFGLTSLNTVAQMVNTNGGPAVSFTGAGIYKTGGQLNWATIASQSTTQSKTLTNYAAAQTGYTRLRVQCEMVQGVAEITYWIDQGNGMIQMQNTSSYPLNKIKDTISLSSPAIMYLGWGIKNGSANAEVMNVDYVAAWGRRATYAAAI